MHPTYITFELGAYTYVRARISEMVEKQWKAIKLSCVRGLLARATGFEYISEKNVIMLFRKPKKFTG